MFGVLGVYNFAHTVIIFAILRHAIFKINCSFFMCVVTANQTCLLLSYVEGVFLHIFKINLKQFVKDRTYLNVYLQIKYVFERVLWIDRKRVFL